MEKKEHPLKNLQKGTMFFKKIGRRKFLKNSSIALTGSFVPLSLTSCDNTNTKTHRWIDRRVCIGCIPFVSLCPMGAIMYNSSINKCGILHDECTECGVCMRSNLCPKNAIKPGQLKFPRTLREAYSNPLAEHDTGVRGRGEEGIKTNDSKEHIKQGKFGVVIEVGRPALGTRFKEVEKIVMKFASMGYFLTNDNPVVNIIKDMHTGEFKPEVLNEKVISCLLVYSFDAQRERVNELQHILNELDSVVKTGFNVCLALRGGQEGMSPINELFGKNQFRLPWVKVNIGMAKNINA